VPWEGEDLPLQAGNWPLLSASPQQFLDGVSQWSRAMTRADMERVRGDFVRSARLAAEAGFDWLELHCAHGYLLSAFISPLTNHRDDEYGGPLEGRLRYPLEVFSAMRAVNGPNRGVRRCSTTGLYTRPSGAVVDTGKRIPPVRVEVVVRPGRRMLRRRAMTAYRLAAVLVLGLAGLASAPRRFRAVALVASAAAVVFSLGPETALYRALHETLVLVRGVRALSRFSLIPVLALSVLAGFALAGRWRRPWWFAAADLAGGITLLGFALLALWRLRGPFL
jgi:hypothetical protein